MVRRARDRGASLADEILVCDGDLVGKSASQVRSLHFLRDLEFLLRPDR